LTSEQKIPTVVSSRLAKFQSLNFRVFVQSQCYFLPVDSADYNIPLWLCLQKKAVGSDLYEQTFYSLDLIEKDYFGLQYTDANNVQVRAQKKVNSLALGFSTLL